MTSSDDWREMNLRAEKAMNARVDGMEREAAVEAAIDAAVQTKEWHAFRRPDIRNAIAAWCLAKADAMTETDSQFAMHVRGYLRHQAAELTQAREGREG